MVKCYTHTKYKRAHNCHPVHLKSSGFRSKIKAKHFHQIGKSLRDRTKIEILLQIATPAGYSSGKFRSNIREIQDKPLFIGFRNPFISACASRRLPATLCCIVSTHESRAEKAANRFFFDIFATAGVLKRIAAVCRHLRSFRYRFSTRPAGAEYFLHLCRGKERKWMRTTRG